MKKDGYVLPVAIYTGLLILVLLGIFLNLASNHIKTMKNKRDMIYAQYAAEAGIEEGMYKLLSVIEKDINEIYDVSYKTSYLNDINDMEIGYEVKFEPNVIDYQLTKVDNETNLFKITGGQFIIDVLSKDKKTMASLKQKVKINITNNGFEYEILDISRNR